jgi:hypothetical protein
MAILQNGFTLRWYLLLTSFVLTDQQMGCQIISISDIRRYRWVGSFLHHCYDKPTKSGSKQARKTGMAGPLGEMFDHGNKASSFPFDRD